MKQSLCAGHRILVVSILLAMAFTAAPAPGEPVDESLWHFSIMAGRLDYEGEEAVKDTGVLSLHAGYDLDSQWTLEGVAYLPPQLDETFRTEWSTGKHISRLEERAGAGVHSTRSARIGLSGIYHLNRGATLDPYLSVGAGMIWYDDSFHHRYEAQLEGGGGLLWQLNGQWSLRTEARVFAVGTAHQLNSVVSAGLVWTPGGTSATRPPLDIPVVVESPKSRIIEAYELHIEFPDGSAKIPAQYNGDLDVVGRSLVAHPDAIARIESHIDRKNGTSERSAVNLTSKRAMAVRDYLSGDKWKIAHDRITAVGYGFSKPKEMAGPATVGSANRRVEITIFAPVDAGNTRPAGTDPADK